MAEHWPVAMQAEGTPQRRSELNVLGVTVCPSGFTHRDVTKKLYAVSSQIDDRQILWKVKNSTRLQRCALLQRIAQSALAWSGHTISLAQLCAGTNF